MKILITGGAGFIGSNLVDKLIEQNHQVAVVDNLSTGKKEYLNPKAKFYKADIQDSKIWRVFKKEKPEIVFHLAAQIDVRKSVKNPIEDAKINILGSLNVIQNFIHYSKFQILDSKFIFLSTGGAIYGEADIIPTPETHPAYPLSPYGIAKLTIEKYLNYYYKVFGLPFVTLRLANVYGPRQSSKGEAGVVAIFCDKMLSGEQATINGNGEQTRDFVFVEDMIEASILAIEKNKIGIFNVGTAKETNINTIFRNLKKIIDSTCKEIHEPAQAGEQIRSCLDYSKIEKQLGWQPKYNIEKGLKKTVKWFIKPH